MSLVTGGASGIGRGTAQYLSQQGAKVAIVDLPKSDGEKVAKELGENVIFTPADVSFFLPLDISSCFLTGNI